jgi:hypothetical protein
VLEIIEIDHLDRPVCPPEGEESFSNPRPF